MHLPETLSIASKLSFNHAATDLNSRVCGIYAYYAKQKKFGETAQRLCTTNSAMWISQHLHRIRCTQQRYVSRAIAFESSE